MIQILNRYTSQILSKSAYNENYLENDEQNDDELQEFHTETEEDIKFASSFKANLASDKEQDDEDVKVSSVPKERSGRRLSEDPENLTDYSLPKSRFPVGEFKFIILSGNPSGSVREMLKIRGNWKEMDNEEEAIESAHLMWRPCNYNTKNFDKISKRNKSSKFPLLFNHFEFIR